MSKEGDGIHVRAVRYGYERPNGFMYKEVEKWYNKRDKEWQIVKKFLNDAFDNFTRGLNRETPYILLEQLGNMNADESKFILSYQAYIQYFEYEELQQAREDSKLAQKLSRKALFIAFLTLVITFIASLVSIYISVKQNNSSIIIDSKQCQDIKNKK